MDKQSQEWYSKIYMKSEIDLISQILGEYNKGKFKLTVKECLNYLEAILFNLKPGDDNIGLLLSNDKFQTGADYVSEKDREQSDINIHLTNEHIGQIKLFFGELLFLTLNHKKSKNILYAGSAPGIHLPLLFEMFPNHSFYLVDPNLFVFKLRYKPYKLIYADDRDLENIQKYYNNVIDIRRTYFTDEMAHEYKNIFREDGCLFISDIRTITLEDRANETTEEKVMKDHNMQNNWVDILKPKATSLKFRGLFTDSKFVTDNNIMDIEYYDGNIYKQIFAGKKSSETRLFINEDKLDKPMNKFNMKDFENKLFYHNMNIRTKKIVSNIKNPFLFKNGYYDGIVSYVILWKFLKNSIEDNDDNEILKKLNVYIERIHNFKLGVNINIYYNYYNIIRG